MLSKLHHTLALGKPSVLFLSPVNSPCCFCFCFWGSGSDVGADYAGLLAVQLQHKMGEGLLVSRRTSAHSPEAPRGAGAETTSAVTPCVSYWQEGRCWPAATPRQHPRRACDPAWHAGSCMLYGIPRHHQCWAAPPRNAHACAHTRTVCTAPHAGGTRTCWCTEAKASSVTTPSSTTLRRRAAAGRCTT